MKEKTLERKLVQAVKASGGIAPKFISPGFDGMPDRIVLLQGGRACFAEIKAAGKTPRALQLKRHEQLQDLGFQVFVIDDVKQITPLLAAMKGGDSE